jgi:hypothetical protein
VNGDTGNLTLIAQIQNSASEILRLMGEADSELNKLTERVNTLNRQPPRNPEEAVKSADNLAVGCDAYAQELEKILPHFNKPIAALTDAYSGYVESLDLKREESRSELETINDKLKGMLTSFRSTSGKAENMRSLFHQLSEQNYSPKLTSSTQKLVGVIDKLSSVFEEMETFGLNTLYLTEQKKDSKKPSVESAEKPMRKYVVEHTTVNCKWTYDRILPSLPGPGTPAFAKLVKALHPFGISAEGVLLDAPSTSLASVTLTISLMKRRVLARITAEAFELIVNGLLEGDDPTLIKIADSIFTALGEVDAESEKGHALVRISSHLKLNPDDLNDIMSEHLITRSPGLIPDTAIYTVKLDGTEAEDLRLLVTKSLGFDSSLFIDLSANYRLSKEPTRVAQLANTDFERVVELLGLKEQVSQESEGV